jgi:heptosyltransferase I
MPAAILRDHPSIDRVIVYRRADGIRGLTALWRDLRRVEKIDVTINFNVYFKSIWPTLFSRAPRRVGFDRSRSFEGVSRAANEHIPEAPRAHTADMFLEFARYLGIEAANPDWRLRFTSEEAGEQRAFFARFAGRPVATVIPASASHKKDWLAERWARVAEALHDQFGFHVILAGGPGEREQAIARDIVSATSTPIEWAMGDSVRRLAWIIGGSNIVVAPDTGPVHIARALGTPVVGIYGHTNPWRVGPWRAYEDLWVDHYTDPVAGPDSSNRTPKWDAMPTIQADEVIDRIRVAVENYDVLSSRRFTA